MKVMTEQNVIASEFYITSIGMSFKNILRLFAGYNLIQEIRYYHNSQVLLTVYLIKHGVMTLLKGHQRLQFAYLEI